MPIWKTVLFTAMLLMGFALLVEVLLTPNVSSNLMRRSSLLRLTLGLVLFLVGSSHLN